MLTSIVILTFNNWQKTLACLNSIRTYTKQPYELIIVDNSSLDETLDNLRQMPDIRLIANKQNKGFAAGVNQGMSAARGDQIVLLNNDTVVSHRWLDNLLAALLSSPQVGIVGPRSNWVIPVQMLNPGYATEAEYHRFADAFNRHDPAKWQEVTCLSGFCVMFRRALVEQIGLMDEQFIFGVYEDADYSYRAMLAGYSLLLAGDTFVYHAGNSGFKGGGLDMKGIAGINRISYIKKWGFDPDRIAYVLDDMFLPKNLEEARKNERLLGKANRIPGGILVKGSAPEVYFLERGKKRLVFDRATFDCLRYDVDRIVTIADDDLAMFPTGIQLNAGGSFPAHFPKSFVAKGSNSSTYLIENGSLIPFHSYEDFAGLKFSFEEIVTVPDEYLASLYYGYWPALQVGNALEEYELPEYRYFAAPDGSFYYSEGQKLRQIVDHATFSFYKWHPDRIISLDEANFRKLSIGRPINR
ncbi:glycosyltransferase family 2 protein [Paenibacillus sp. MBLB4367]|uniref:glycosyltransferase family 2 protein n=1 Tax=Paenibacillus sp. MBLB4367 TaxID=3384767 RepID=UPI003907F4B6